MPTRKTFVVIDAHALIHRAYHALPSTLTSPKGEPLNAVYGFTSVLIKTIKDLSPDYLIAAFDLPAPTFRHKTYAEYKATRVEADAELKQQIPVVRSVVAAFGIPILEKEGFEADDIIGTVVQKLQVKKNVRCIIVSGDLDTLQLVRGDDVTVFTLRKGVTDTALYNEKKVRERYGGLGPAQLPDFKGLTGDASDNIPGVPGIGEKTAIKLLGTYATIEKLLNRKEDESIPKGIRNKLIEYEDQALFSKQLATIRRDVPIEVSLTQSSTNSTVTPDLLATLKSLGFKSLIDRLGVNGESKSSSNNAVLATEDDIERYRRDGVLSSKVYELERSLTPVLRAMEQRGFLIDKTVLNTLSESFKKELSRIEKKAAQYASKSFNLNSPQEVGRVLFEELKLGGSRRKKTRTGQYSTTAAELERIEDEHPIVGLIARWRELAKLKSTYLDTLPGLVSKKDGRIHTTFKQFGAATGRISSENPNVQNIPIRGEYGSEIRKAFIASKGYMLLSADYSQIELRIAASLSSDRTMIAAFKKGEDIHTRTAAEVFDVSLDKVTKDMRRQAKVLNFGVLYGMGSRAFSRAAEISLEEAKRFIDEYRTNFHELSAFIEDTKTRAYSQGYVETVWGRRRYVPELSSTNEGLRAAGERIAVNMPIQGTAADVIKAAMVHVARAFEKDDNVHMILQIHDELVFEVRKGKEKTYAQRIAGLMEGVLKLKVPLKTEVEAGRNWGEMSRIAL
jgi:DNA polymerase I-like protein with 3'-5' exonuclease and polymerase domains